MTIRRTYKVHLVSSSAPHTGKEGAYRDTHFYNGINVGYSSWRDGKQGGEFAKPKRYYQKLSDSFVATTLDNLDKYTDPTAVKECLDTFGIYIGTTALRYIVAELKKVMPYLQVFSTTEDGCELMFFHDHNDFPVGFISTKGHYNMKSYAIFSPLNDNFRNGGQSSDSIDTIIRLARKYFKYIPPANMLPFVAAKSDYHFFCDPVRDIYSKLQRSKYNFYVNSLGTTEASEQMAKVLNTWYDSNPELMEKQMPDVKELIQKTRRKERKLLDKARELQVVAYVQLSDEPGQMYISYLRNPDAIQLTQEGEVDPTNKSLYFSLNPNALPAPKLMNTPEDILVKVSQLLLEEDGGFVEGVGKRLDSNQFMVYATEGDVDDVPQAN